MSKKKRKEALKFLCDNVIIHTKFRIAAGIGRDVPLSESRRIFKDMINDFYERGPRDYISVITGGIGSMSGGKSLKGYKYDNSEVLDILAGDDDDDEEVQAVKGDIPDFLK